VDHPDLRIVTPVDYDRRPNLYDSLQPRPSLVARIGDALGSERMFGFYLGAYAGCMATVGAAIIWSRVLS
jgi:hypothetical protein